MQSDRGAAIARGIAYIAGAQAADGGFVSYSSPTRKRFNPQITYRTTFVPAIMLGALTNVPGATSVANSLQTWLLQQRSPEWSFNYWAAQAPERTSQPYPDDLDVIACALIGLWRHNPSLLDGNALGAIVRLLLATENKIGGPYRTWLVPPDSPAIWLDVDLAVNCNVACFLRLVAEPLPSLTALMDQAIRTHAYTSPYYPSPYPIWYYMARAYTGPLKPLLVRHILRTQSKAGHWASPLQTALALTALRDLSVPLPSTALNYLVTCQQSNGSWPAESFSIDPAKKGRKYYHGANALTTALVLEALTPPVAQKTAKTPRPKRAVAAANSLYTSIVRTARQDIAHLKGPLKTENLRMLHRIEQLKNSDEIILMPQLFLQSLANPPTNLQAALLEHLGIANLYGWIAYTIYDDFLDNEGKTSELSVANVAMRYSLTRFSNALPHSDAYRKHVNTVFDLIDSANAWEIANARYTVSQSRLLVGQSPPYGSLKPLAERSLGHTLPPMGILAAMGIPPHDPRAVRVQRAFKHYIIARQLSDDIHDWQEDIRGGRITYTVACVLKDMNIQPGRHNLATLLPRMQLYFWHHTSTAICDTITHHITSARTQATQSGLLTPNNLVTNLCQPIEQTVITTLREQQKAKDFLRAYSI